MSKQALCIQREHAPIDFTIMAAQPIPAELFDAPAGLVDREICEEGDAFLQLIPYIVVRNQSGMILCYERGSAGGEERLHAKLSIGIGGHVDRAQNPGETLEQLLYAEAARELTEELGITANTDEFQCLVYTGATGQPVDQVHLGLVASIVVDEESIKPEAGHIEGAGWLSLGELMQTDNFERLEPWSQAVVNGLNEALSRNLGDTLEAIGNLLSEISISSPSGGTGSVAQEVSGILWAVAHNLQSGVATARVYDETTASDIIDELVEGIDTVQHQIGCGWTKE